MRILILAALIAGTGSAMAADAKIKLFQYQPSPIEVKAGESVTWTNGDDIEHSVTAGAPGKESGAFDSGFFKKDGTFTQAFDKPGEYDYFCKRHNSMKGKVVVTE
jgi:plastocyanin